MKHLSRRISFPVLLTALLLSVFVLSDATVMAAGKTKLIVPKKETCYEIGENGTETFSYSAQYTYDKKGDVTKETTKYPDETVVYTYKRNKQGEVKSLVTQSNGTNSTKETTKYKKKKRVSGKSYVWNATAGAWQTSGSCTYKSTKKKLETWQYDAAKALEYHHIEKYNKKGLVTSLRTYDAAGKTTNLEDSTYDKKGNINREKYYDADDLPICCLAGYAIVYREYDAFNRVDYEKFYGPDGFAVMLEDGAVSYRYVYDDEGQLLKTTKYDFADHEVE